MNSTNETRLSAHRLSSAHRQYGMGMLSMLVAILVCGVSITCAVKMVPFYVENWNIKSILGDLQEQFNGDPTVKKEDIVDKLNKRMYIDMVEAISAKDISVRKENTGYVVNANYEKRVNLFGNVDVVMVFDNNEVEISLTGR
ncbi:MAG: DUF4845 domain-containing protein [Gammaproteobacteria bacterium]|nr:DUF4845 domain-containing protein [Gammaproteobacteria bacterium]